jgi:hypothetical protein
MRCNIFLDKSGIRVYCGSRIQGGVMAKKKETDTQLFILARKAVVAWAMNDGKLDAEMALLSEGAKTKK